METDREELTRERPMAECCAKGSPPAALRVCVHALRPARSDVRTVRTVTALARAGFAVVVVDVEHDRMLPREEWCTPRAYLESSAAADGGDAARIHFKHIQMWSRFSRHYDPVYLVPWLVFKGLRMVRGLLVVLRTPADIYHASDITALPACYLAARLRRKGLIFDSYELPLVQPWITRLPLLPRFAALLLRYMVSRCDGIITVSPPIVPEFKRRYGGPNAVVVRNIPMYTLPLRRDQLRNYLGLGPHVRIVLYQGLLSLERGLDVLVSAARFLEPNIVLVLMGSGQYGTVLQRMAREEEVSDRVRIIPPVPYSELPTWTASADLGLVVLRTEALSYQLCLPNKLFEYLMAGVPVLASPLEAVVEVIREYQAGSIVPWVTPEGVGKAINTLLKDQELLAAMRRNALSAAKRDLRWEVEGQRLIHLYWDIISVRNSGRIVAEPRPQTAP